ncbi:LAMI_0H10396g1_1 [Lachancea mirantina]|uniref:LAMI_0H10396g1_1 n=1 Tax=Lachancea mirantina TaxID=1230905 RepID=A0A1G4KGT4_9SACH|nr:LAMI_0H10396g1_1 [Lachancea mirantina]
MEVEEEPVESQLGEIVKEPLQTDRNSDESEEAGEIRVVGARTGSIEYPDKAGKKLASADQGEIMGSELKVVQDESDQISEPQQIGDEEVDQATIDVVAGTMGVAGGGTCPGDDMSEFETGEIEDRADVSDFEAPVEDSPKNPENSNSKDSISADEVLESLDRAAEILPAQSGSINTILKNADATGPSGKDVIEVSQGGSSIEQNSISEVDQVVASELKVKLEDSSTSITGLITSADVSVVDVKEISDTYSHAEEETVAGEKASIAEAVSSQESGVDEENDLASQLTDEVSPLDEGGAGTPTLELKTGEMDATAADEQLPEAGVQSDDVSGAESTSVETTGRHDEDVRKDVGEEIDAGAEATPKEGDRVKDELQKGINTTQENRKPMDEDTNDLQIGPTLNKEKDEAVQETDEKSDVIVEHRMTDDAFQKVAYVVEKPVHEPEEESIDDLETSKGPVSQAVDVGQTVSDGALSQEIEDTTIEKPAKTESLVTTPLSLDTDELERTQATGVSSIHAVTDAVEDLSQLRDPPSNDESESLGMEEDVEAGESYSPKERQAELNHKSVDKPSDKGEKTEPSLAVQDSECQTAIADITDDIDDLLRELDFVDDSDAAMLIKEIENKSTGKTTKPPSTAAADTTSVSHSEIQRLLENEPVYIYTSLAGGGFHMPSRTNRLAQILTANQIKFTYRDLGTDLEAKNVWKRFSKGRLLPGVVRGRDDIIGNWEEMEDANEDYKVRELIFETL